MLFYPGTTVQPKVGDFIKIENETLEVEEVIIGSKQRELWGVSENGIMIIGGSYGRLFDNLDHTSQVEYIKK